MKYTSVIDPTHQVLAVRHMDDEPSKQALQVMLRTAPIHFIFLGSLLVLYYPGCIRRDIQAGDWVVFNETSGTVAGWSDTHFNKDWKEYA